MQEHAQANAEKNQKDIKTENESTKTTQSEQQEMETNSNDINNNVEKQISNNMEYNPFKYKEY